MVAIPSFVQQELERRRSDAANNALPQSVFVPRPELIVPDDAPMLDHALGYAQLGWPVVALHTIHAGRCTCGKKRCGTSSGKHPFQFDWPKLATTDPRIVRSYWAEEHWNVGLLTPPRRIIADVDPRNGGMKTLHGLIAEHGDMPATPTAESGSGGWHFYLDLPPGVSLSNLGKAPLGPGIDLKRAGGQTTAPPSLHLSGKRYRWYRHPAVTPVATAPQWLLEKCTRVSASQKKPNGGGAQRQPNDDLRQHLINGRVPKGRRREELLRIAGVLFATRLFCKPDYVLALVWGFACQFCEQTPPIEWKTVEDLCKWTFEQERRRRGVSR